MSLDALMEAWPLEQAMGALVGPGRVPEPVRRLAVEAAAVAPPAQAAGIWLYIDDLEASHTVSQGIETDLGSAWHAVMHRREGDFSNAKYWWARVRRPLDLQIPGYDPVGFVDAVARAEGNPPDLVERQRAEWSALMSRSV